MWFAKYNRVTAAVVDANGHYVAENIRGVTEAERDERVRLIAAAPDLLAACIESRDAQDADDADTVADRYERLLAAIAKATGEVV